MAGLRQQRGVQRPRPQPGGQRLGLGKEDPQETWENVKEVNCSDQVIGHLISTKSVLIVICNPIVITYIQP